MSSPQERDSELFALLPEKPVTEQNALLQNLCGGKQELRQRLEALLAAQEHPDPALGTQQGLEVPGAAVRPSASASLSMNPESQTTPRANL